MSVSWHSQHTSFSQLVGLVAVFFALSIIGLTIHNVQLARGVYLGLDLITKFVIVPCAIGSFMTGVISSLGTEWGLFRHYWVMVKLVITILSTTGLLAHIRPIAYLAGIAAGGTLPSGDYPIQMQIVIVSGLALGALLVSTVLSVYKPRGITPYGWRKQQKRRRVSQ